MAKLRYTESYGANVYIGSTLVRQANRVYLQAQSTIATVKRYYGYSNDTYNITLELWSDNAGDIGELLETGSTIEISDGVVEIKTFTITSGDLSAGYYWIIFHYTNIDAGKYGKSYAHTSDSLLTDVAGWSSQSTVRFAYTTGVEWNYVADSTMPGLEVSGTAGAPPEKATTPAPENAAEDQLTDLEQLSWVDGGGATSYDVRFGESGDMSLRSSGQEGLTFSLSEIELSWDTAYQWRIDSVNDSGTTEGDTWSFTTLAAPEKAVNPTPTDEDTEVDFSDLTLSWEDGGGTETYDVCVGPVDDLSLVSEGQADVSYITNLEELPYDEVIYWRVDAVNDAGTTEGDVWSFDARPAKAITPIPGDTTEDQKISLAELSWADGGGADTYKVYFGLGDGDLTLVSEGLDWLLFELTELETALAYYTGYQWSIDSVNDFGVTEGDVWTFTSMKFAPPLPTGMSLYDGGTPTGENNILQVRRIVAAVLNTIWYEDV